MADLGDGALHLAFDATGRSAQDVSAPAAMLVRKGEFITQDASIGGHTVDVVVWERGVRQ